MRIVMLKNVSHGDMRLKVGGYYALPESLAQDLVDARVAYWECDDPPFDPETREEIARESERANNAAMKLREFQRQAAAREEAERLAEEYTARRRAEKIAAIFEQRAAEEALQRAYEDAKNAARLAAEQDKE